MPFTSRHGSGDRTGQDAFQKAAGSRRGEGTCLTLGVPAMALTLGDRQQALACFIF